MCDAGHDRPGAWVGRWVVREGEGGGLFEDVILMRVKDEYG